jgi:uncharacterized membrane protein
MKKRRFPKVTVDVTLVVLVVVLLLLFVVLPLLPSVYPQRQFEGTLQEKFVKTKESKGVYMLIIETAQGREVFVNKDNLFFWKFNSSDVYANLNEGETYLFTSVGFRFPLLSMYKNIVRVE